VVAELFVPVCGNTDGGSMGSRPKVSDKRNTIRDHRLELNPHTRAMGSPPLRPGMGPTSQPRERVASPLGKSHLLRDRDRHAIRLNTANRYRKIDGIARGRPLGYLSVHLVQSDKSRGKSREEHGSVEAVNRNDR